MMQDAKKKKKMSQKKRRARYEHSRPRQSPPRPKKQLRRMAEQQERAVGVEDRAEQNALISSVSPEKLEVDPRFVAFGSGWTWFALLTWFFYVTKLFLPGRLVEQIVDELREDAHGLLDENDTCFDLHHLPGKNDKKRNRKTVGFIYISKGFALSRPVASMLARVFLRGEWDPSVAQQYVGRLGECSHLCHISTCACPTHLVLESAYDNQLRERFTSQHTWDAQGRCGQHHPPCRKKDKDNLGMADLNKKARDLTKSNLFELKCNHSLVHGRALYPSLTAMKAEVYCRDMPAACQPGNGVHHHCSKKAMKTKDIFYRLADYEAHVRTTGCLGQRGEAYFHINRGRLGAFKVVLPIRSERLREFTAGMKWNQDCIFKMVRLVNEEFDAFMRHHLCDCESGPRDGFERRLCDPHWFSTESVEETDEAKVLA
ncbi:hypothetical protein KC315_g10825 [Hortaea werneckii]|nr:hypothetical protein KC342_g8386 [Hortaea werneckii]KAI7097035.1 hypothetical protein KC339_g9968 [Hortaea werneckii]KAI7236559.1 hypothetical protein KC365_g5128 [Hortaea werneckii]KAI7308836.1 hypothetical protein KC340_g10901 [Hortaea werneckii]KAI7316279.1 hypothetical protein KC315_g10825 [Hortaea werneckii]